MIQEAKNWFYGQTRLMQMLVVLVPSVFVLSSDALRGVALFGFFLVGIYHIGRWIFGRGKRKGIQAYTDKLKEFFLDGALDEKERASLDAIKKEYNLNEGDVVHLHKNIAETFFNTIIADRAITDDETKKLIEIHKELGLQENDIAYDQNTFNKYRILYSLQQGVVPIANVVGLNIRLAEGEQVHFATKASIVRNKEITKRITYGGLTSSVRICKGLSYRVGSVSVRHQKIQVTDVEDVGAVYLTSKMFGYMGVEKHFSFPYEKIAALEVRDNYLYVYKTGKEKPYMMALDDYEVLLAITSFKIENE